MEKKTKLRIIQVLCIISILMTFFSIQKTYAKYYEKVNTVYTTALKRWVIKVNGFNIHEYEQLTNEIMTPVFVHNDHMNDNNTLVPGREGYFPFEIDYENVDLVLRFGFDIKQLNNLPLEDFEVYGYEIIDGSDTDIIIEIDDISKINPVINSGSDSEPIEVASIEYELDGNSVIQELDDDKKVEIRILFRWNDENKDTTDADENLGMNNSEDTAFEGEENTEDDRIDDLHQILKYNVEIKFTQEF